MAAAALLSAAAGLAGCQYAPPPVTLSAAPPASLSRPATTLGGRPKAVPITCAVGVTELSDIRNDPGMIGVYMNKAVLAPTDRPAWLRALVTGLAERGVLPVLPGDPPVATAPSDITIVLEKAWITNIFADIGASVSFRVDEHAPGGTVTQMHFRGTRQKFTYWSQAENKFQRAIDLSASQALDAMAEHFHTLCKASGFVMPSGR